MQKDKRKIDGCTVHLRHYRDWLDFVGCAERVMREQDCGRLDGLNCTSLEKGQKDWFGTSSLEDAVRLACAGWPEGRERLQEARKRLEIDTLLPRAQRLVREIDVSGDEPDIDLYLNGEPEHMATLHETIDQSRGKVLRLVLNRSNSCFVHGEKMVRRGLALLMAIENLLVLGYTVEVSIVFAVGNGDEKIEQLVPILHAGDPINPDTLAFMFLHPAVLRRLCFATEECEPYEIRQRFGFNGGSYGVPLRPPALPSCELFIDHDEGLLGRDADIVPYALEILQRVGVKTND